MENYILSCCSTMDLRKGWAEERGVNLIYAKFFLEGEEFRDDFYESISQEKLFERMLSGEKSQTTQVNTEEYIDSFRKYLEQGQDIFHICLSSGVSGTFNSCHIAKDILQEEFPERKIEIVDSLMASSGYGLLVDKACMLKKQVIENILSKMEKEGYLSTEKCFISHSACPQDAEKLAESIRERFHPEGSIEIFDIGGTIACHTGPGTVSSFFFGKEKAYN